MGDIEKQGLDILTEYIPRITIVLKQDLVLLLAVGTFRGKDFLRNS